MNNQGRDHRKKEKGSSGKGRIRIPPPEEFEWSGRKTLPGWAVWEAPGGRNFMGVRGIRERKKF